jgi:hypothetical protein
MAARCSTLGGQSRAWAKRRTAWLTSRFLLMAAPILAPQQLNRLEMLSTTIARSSTFGNSRMLLCVRPS